MGGANTKALNASTEADLNDPRSPSLKRTPLSTPASAGSSNWREAAAALRAAQQEEDPRSPSIVDRTPLREPSSSNLGDMTPLTLSYGVEYLKNSAQNALDPRSPMGFRTPLHNTQAIIKFDSPVVACGSFVDDTVVIGDFREEPKTQPEAPPAAPSAESKEITVSAIINTTTLSGMNIFSSKEDVVPAEDEIVEDEIPIAKNDELQQSPAIPLSPSRALAQSTEEVSKTEKVFVPPKLTQSGYVSSPALLGKEPATRKRKNPMKQELLGVSPLKKSFSSPACTFENDENEMLPPSPKTPTTARRASIKNAAAQAGNRSPRATQNKASPRSPLSPITPRTAKRRAPKLNRESSAPILL